MDSVAVTVPLRPPTKKMKKRKELDALAPPRAISRRSSSGKRSSQELLTDSSDERSADYWNVSTRGVRCKSVRDRPRPACRGLLRACSVFLGGTLVLVTVVLIWLFIDVRQQLTALRVELDQVIAGSEGVPDALQTCHTLEKSFRSNITHITLEMQNLNGSINNFSVQLSNLQQELKLVQNSIKSAPELTQLPRKVTDLQNSVGQLLGDFNELQTSYASLKNSTSTLQQLQDKQRQSLSKYENTLTSLSNRSEQPQTVPITNETMVETKKLWDAVEELRKNLTHINQSLTTNLTWVQEDFAKDHKTVVSLQDMAQNASAQILTLQQECVKEKKDFEALQTLLRSLTDKVNKVSIGTNNNSETPKEIEHLYNGPQISNGDTMMAAPSSQAKVVVEQEKDKTDSKSSDVPKATPVSPSPTM